jgi:transposase
VRKLEERVRELERLLGRKTMEVEILREALSKANSKKPIWRPLSLPKGGSR